MISYLGNTASTLVIFMTVVKRQLCGPMSSDIVNAVRRDPKPHQFKSVEERRRAILERQRNARRDVIQLAREWTRFDQRTATTQLHTETQNGTDNGAMLADDDLRVAVSSIYLRRRNFSLRFQYPTHIVDTELIPPATDMHEWIIRPRVEGVRCLVVAQHNRTISRRTNGTLLHTFTSLWPGGGGGGGLRNSKSRHQHQQQDNATIIDCIYNAHRRTYYILDLLQYRSIALFETTLEFRLWFIQSKLEELISEINISKNRNTLLLSQTYSFILIPRFPLNIDNWNHLYEMIRNINASIQHQLTSHNSDHYDDKDDEMNYNDNNDDDVDNHHHNHDQVTMAIDEQSSSSVAVHYAVGDLSNQLDCRSDGILLCHKESFYENGITELCLLYRNQYITQYNDNHQQRNNNNTTTCILQVADDGLSLITVDGIYIRTNHIQQHYPPKTLLKCFVALVDHHDNNDIIDDDQLDDNGRTYQQRVATAHVQANVINVASAARTLSDSWSSLYWRLLLANGRNISNEQLLERWKRIPSAIT